MKNFLTIILLLVIFSMSALSVFSQTEVDPEKKWSVIYMDPGTQGNIEAEPKWEPVNFGTKYYDFGSGITVEPNFRPYGTTNSTQSETSVDVHPTDNNIVFCSANATAWPVSGVYGTGVYWTLDGGTTWAGTDNPATIPGFGSNSGDPASVIGTNGYFYENYISNPGGQGISRSTDNGANWTSYTVAPNPGSLADKNHMMIDKKSGSPYENRLYCTWTDFGGVNDEDVVLRYSTNFGQNWTSSFNLSSTLSPGSHAQGTNVQTGPNGEVYVTYAIYDAWPGGEDAIGFSKSTDGGATWTHARIYSAVNFGIRGNLSSKNGIRVASFPSMGVDRSGGANDGNIYICWPQRGVSPAGSDPDIVLIKSTDGGSTWSSPVRVNDDPLSNGKDQYYPWCTVDQATGQLMLVFFDSRDVPNNQADVYMARSLDGGNTFENFKVSDAPHTPSPISGLASGYAGDYIGVAAHDDVAYPYWGENRTSIYQGWMSVVTFGPPCPVDPPSNPDPANGATVVSVSLSQLTWTNGAGANQVEVWFGEAGNMTMVYDGALISSWSVPGPLDYNTAYNWRIKGKNDTCTVAGPIWAFTTELSPGVLFIEPFNDLSCWTPIGPLGSGNWSINSSNNAGGSAPELNLNWSPQFNGLSQLLSCVIPANNNRDLKLTFVHFIDDFSATPSPYLGVAVSYNGGTSSTTLWEVQPNGNLGPEPKELLFTTPSSGSENLQLIIYCNGDSYNIDDWYVDEMMLEDLTIPVELSSFTASVRENSVELNWNTATETNNQGFDVERQSSNGGFEKIGYVAGFGTTTEPKAYSFTDVDVNAGEYTYRLKQVDFDGSYEYSSEINVVVELPIEYALEQNYPNPFNPSTNIKYSIPEDGFVKLVVYNMLGEQVASLIETNQKAGRYEVTFNASELASGVYIYRLEAANYTSSKKLMLMK